MSTKLPDIAKECYLFDTYGRCPYGPACRFASAHLTAEYENIIDHEQYKPSQPSPVVNVLSKSLQERLRKRAVQFPQSDLYLKGSVGGTPGGKAVLKGSVGGTPGGKVVSRGLPGVQLAAGCPPAEAQSIAELGGLCTTADAVGPGEDATQSDQFSGTGTPSGGQICATDIEAGSASVSKESHGFETTAEGCCQVTSGSGCQATADGVVPDSPSGGCPLVPMCGALTDDDTIRLRAEEKRRVSWLYNLVVVWFNLTSQAGSTFTGRLLQ